MRYLSLLVPTKSSFAPPHARYLIGTVTGQELCHNLKIGCGSRAWPLLFVEEEAMLTD